MTLPLLVALDLAAVLILLVLVAELARLRFRPRPRPVAIMAEPTYEFCRPAEFGPLAVSRAVIDKTRNAMFVDQIMAISDKRYSRWSKTDREQWIWEWVEHRDDYVSSITTW